MKEELDFISKMKVRSYVSLFEEYVAIKLQIERTIQDEYLVRLNKSLVHKKIELSKAFNAVAERIGEEKALELVKEAVEKFGGYDQLKE